MSVSPPAQKAMKTLAFQQEIKLWRKIVFCIVVVLITLVFVGLFQGPMALLSPWTGPMVEDDPTVHAAIHIWHNATWGTLGTIMWAGSVVTLLWGGQKRPLVAQFFLIGMFLLLAELAVPGRFHPVILAIGGGISAVFILAYPAPRELISFTRRGPVNIVLLVLGLLLMIGLIPPTWQNIVLQFTEGSEHARLYHWLDSALLYVLIMLAGILAATRRDGWQVLGFLVGLALLALGAAAVTQQVQAGSWGLQGGLVALFGGLVYIVATLFEMRRGVSAR